MMVRSGQVRNDVLHSTLGARSLPSADIQRRVRPSRNEMTGLVCQELEFISVDDRYSTRSCKTCNKTVQGCSKKARRKLATVELAVGTGAHRLFDAHILLSELV